MMDTLLITLFSMAFIYLAYDVGYERGKKWRKRDRKGRFVKITPNKEMDSLLISKLRKEGASEEDIQSLVQKIFP